MGVATVMQIDWTAYARCAHCGARPGMPCKDMRAKHVDKYRVHPHPGRGMKRGARR